MLMHKPCTELNATYDVMNPTILCEVQVCKRSHGKWRQSTEGNALKQSGDKIAPEQLNEVVMEETGNAAWQSDLPEQPDDCCLA